MTKKLIVVLMMFVLGCSHSSTSTSAPQEERESFEISSGDVLRLQEVARIRSKVGDEVWPGFAREELGMVLVGPQYQWTLDIDEPPSYYTRVGVPLHLHEVVQTISITKSYRDPRGNVLPEVPEELHQAFSKEQTGGHYRQAVFFVKTLEGFQNSNAKMTSEEWIRISLRELFQVFQDRYVKYTPEFLKSVEAPFKNKISEDEEHRKLLEPEMKRLKDAACEENTKKMKEHVKAAMKLRQKRWDYIAKKYRAKPDSWERYDAWAEGTASYVERQILALWPKYAEETLLAKDPAFNKFEAYKREGKSAWCETLAIPEKNYWTSLGFAYALIMDRFDIDWKRKKVSTRFFDGYFRDLGLL